MANLELDTSQKIEPKHKSELKTKWLQELKKLDPNYHLGDYESLESELVAIKYRDLKSEQLKSALQNCPVGAQGGRSKAKENGDAFRAICANIFETVLQEDFEFCEPIQEQSTLRFGRNKGFKKPDIVIKNSYVGPISSNVLWNKIKQPTRVKGYDCEYIVFECKNNAEKNKVSGWGVYQLFGYLIPKKTGRFGILVSRYNNLDPGAEYAIVKITLDDYFILHIHSKNLVELIEEWELTGSISKGVTTIFDKKFTEALSLPTPDTGSQAKEMETVAG